MMGRPRKVRLEGDESPATAETALVGGVSFSAVVERFKGENPDAWGEMRTWPLESGIAAMIERLG